MSAIVPIVICFFVLGLILGGFFLKLGNKGEVKQCPEASQSDKKTKVDVEDIKRVKYRIPRSAPYVGPKHAPVTIAVFDDFQCPYCSKFSKVLKNVMGTNKGKIKFVLVNFPLSRIHKEAQMAAEAGMEAFEQGKFLELHNLIFDNQRDINRENVEKWAKKIGMDVDKLKKALDENKYAQQVKKQMISGRMIGVRGTPTVLVNGRRFRMSRNLKQAETSLRNMVKQEIQIVKKRNLSPQKAYAALTANGVKNLRELRKKPKRNARKKKRRTRKVVDPNQVYQVTYTDKDPWKGGEKPLVTIVEFSDYQCPYCGRVEPTIKQVLDTYKDDVKLVYLQNALGFHKLAKPAANAAFEVLEQKGLDGFWKFHKHLFENRKEISMENLEKWAKEVSGLNMAKFKEAMKTNKHMAEIERAQKLAAKFGARGTPAFFINGRFFSGARPFQSFKTIIDQEIAKAKKTIEEGKATRDNYYEFIMKTALPKAKYITQKIPNRKKRPPRPQLDRSKVYKTPTEGLPFFGDPDGHVVFVLGFDVQCPYCTRIMEILTTVYKGGKTKNGSEVEPVGKGVKFVIMHFPLRFHKQAMKAQQAMQEVFEQKGHESFFKYLTILSKNRKDLGEEKLLEYAKQVGANIPKLKKALAENKHKELIQKTMKAAKAIGVRGTPAVYLNGKSLRGRSVRLYHKYIEQARKEAEDYIKQNDGVNKKNYFDTIMKSALPKAVYKKPPQGGKVRRAFG
jgi:protein-disulfide isomerase